MQVECLSLGSHILLKVMRCCQTSAQGCHCWYAHDLGFFFSLWCWHKSLHIQLSIILFFTHPPPRQKENWRESDTRKVQDNYLCRQKSKVGTRTAASSLAKSKTFGSRNLGSSPDIGFFCSGAEEPYINSGAFLGPQGPHPSYNPDLRNSLFPSSFKSSCRRACSPPSSLWCSE